MDEIIADLNVLEKVDKRNEEQIVRYIRNHLTFAEIQELKKQPTNNMGKITKLAVSMLYWWL